MRQLWITLALLAALSVGLLLLGRAIDTLAAPMAADLTQAAESAQAGDWAAAQARIRRAADRWEGAGGWLQLTESHESISEIASLLDEAAVYASEEDAGACRAAAQRAARALRLLREAERVSLGNLF